MSIANSLAERKGAGSVRPVPDSLESLPTPFGDGPLGKLKVRDHLERQIRALLSEGGAWHTLPNRAALASIARALVLQTDECGAAWPSESTIREWTGYGVPGQKSKHQNSTIQRALAIIAGDHQHPGALYARRFRSPGERYCRGGASHASTPSYFYVAHLPEASTLRLAADNTKPPQPRLPALLGGVNKARKGHAVGCRCTDCTAQKLAALPRAGRAS